MSGEVKRMRYITGLFMNESEFETDQQYHMQMRRLHNRRMHTPGIVRGLELVAYANTYLVDILPGLALDVYYDDALSQELSREILLTEKATIDFANSHYAGGAKVYVWLQYTEMEADASSKAGGQPIHWLESFLVVHNTTMPENEGLYIILGRVVFNESGGVSSIEYEDDDGNPLRRYAGFYAKHSEMDRLILTDDAISEDFPHLDGKLFIPEGGGSGVPGIEVNSLKTGISGDLQVDGNLTVKGSSTKLGTSQLSVKDPLITLNDAEQGSGVTDRYAGVRLLRGLLDAVRLVYDEEDDRWKAGVEGAEEVLAYLSDVYTHSQLDALFSGTSAAGKKQVEWVDVLNKIEAYTKSEINNFFSGISATGKMQIDWSNVLNRINGYTETQIDDFFNGKTASGKMQVDWDSVINKNRTSFETAPVGTQIAIPSSRVSWYDAPPKGTGWARLTPNLVGSNEYNYGVLNNEACPCCSTNDIYIVFTSQLPTCNGYVTAIIIDPDSPGYGQTLSMIERKGHWSLVQDNAGPVTVHFLDSLVYHWEIYQRQYSWHFNSYSYEGNNIYLKIK